MMCHKIGRPPISTMPETPTIWHTLWHRESRRHKWRVVGRAAYAPAALALIDASGIRGGMWMLIADEHDPNTKPPEADR